MDYEKEIAILRQEIEELKSRKPKIINTTFYKIADQECDEFSSGLNRKIKIIQAGYFAKTPQRTLIVNGTIYLEKIEKLLPDTLLRKNPQKNLSLYSNCF